MTEAPDTPRLTFTDLAEAVDALRERGLRLSTPRRLVLEALFTADGPISAERISTTLRLDLTSVYRNLETLEHHGLARHVHLGHGPGLYALVGRGEHEFIACERCGAVLTLTPDQLDPIRSQIRQLSGYQAHFTHFAIVGLCPACATQPDKANQPPTTPNGQPLTSPNPPEEPDHRHEHSHGDHIHSHPHSHPHSPSEQREHHNPN
ncbi:MAG: Fur family transcriptional regulator [Solirubrobacteraceae bacterium]|jgi:Fur family ferric uptake transcriptional regulator